MIGATATSVHRLAEGDVGWDIVLSGSCPVPYFGDICRARVATVGINPSNREFIDDAGNELDGDHRRFPTLASLGIPNWGEATSCDIQTILDACDSYFTGHPYERWFRVLDGVITLTGSTYYCTSSPAAHLDLVPFATVAKWGELRSSEQRVLLGNGGDVLGALLRDSPVELLVLNGRSVVKEFERVCDTELTVQRCPAWDLGRNGTRRVEGLGFFGSIEKAAGVELGRRVEVLGFNLNVQSSFGVTRQALSALAEWVASKAAG